MNKRTVKILSIVFVAFVVCLLIVLVVTDKGHRNDADVKNKTECSVTFLDYYGNILKKETVNKGKNVTPPEAPYVEGFVFKRWNNSLVNIQSDMEFRAVYEEVSDPVLAMNCVVTSASDKLVSVQVYLMNNPGLSSLLFDLYYDEGLKLEKVECAQDFGEFITAPEPFSNPQTISMISSSKDVETSGMIATLVFSIDESVVKDDCSVFNIRIVCNKDNTFNEDFEDVELKCISGTVTVIR